MRNNNKGFMLVETLLVSVFVVSTLIFVYIQFEKVRNSYQTSFEYNTINGLYGADTILKYLRENGIDNLNNTIKNGAAYVDITNCPGGYLSNTSFCHRLMTDLKIKKIFYTPIDITEFKNKVGKSAISNKFKQFIRTIKPEEDETGYRIIVEYEDETYASILTNRKRQKPGVPTAKIRYESSTGTEKKNDQTWTNKTLWLGEFKASDKKVKVHHFEYSDGCTEESNGKLDSEYKFTKDVNKKICIRAVDKYGNVSDWSEPYYIKVDKTKPTCGSISFSGTAGSSGWYRSNVTVNKTDGTDSLSGHKSTILSDTSITSETSGKTVTLTTTDNAGNTCSITKTVKIDKTKPTCGTISFSGTTGNNGWYRSNVTVNKTNGRDSLSGHASTTTSHSSITSDTKGTTVTLTTTDTAGNTCSTTKTVKVDKTNPTCGSISFSGTAGNNGWYRSNVTVNKTNGSDSVSGHASTTISHSSVTSDTKGTTVTLTTKDNAGNACSTTKTVKIDKTAPNAGSVKLEKTDGTDGNRGNVIGSYTPNTWSKNYVLASTTGSSDATSGVAKREIVVVAGSASGNGTFQQDSRSIQASGTSTVYYKITDNAGNVSQTSSKVIKIDRYSPSSPKFDKLILYSSGAQITSNGCAGKGNTRSSVNCSISLKAPKDRDLVIAFETTKSDSHSGVNHEEFKWTHNGSGTKCPNWFTGDCGNWQAGKVGTFSYIKFSNQAVDNVGNEGYDLNITVNISWK